MQRREGRISEIDREGSFSQMKIQRRPFEAEKKSKGI